MKVVIAVSLALLGCGNDITTTGADAQGMGGGPAANVSGHITANATWTGTVNVTAATTIDAGVTVTVMPGTTINVVANGVITVAGTLDVQGTSAATVTIKTATASAYWGGVLLPAGGQYTAHYVVQTGGGTHLSGGSVTLVDSAMSNSSGDYLTSEAGNIDMSYSALGLEPGMANTTHCELHIDAITTLKVTHSNISASAYGIMFYGGHGADFTYDNWFSNGVDIDSGSVTGDFSFSWFAKGAPLKSGLTMNNMATARVTDAGPRP